MKTNTVKFIKSRATKIAKKSKKCLRATDMNCPVPRQVPYHKLMEFIKTIPIGKIYRVYESLCEGLDDAEKVHGFYLNIRELRIKLAEFYLYGCSGHEISWFGQEYTFCVSLGRDAWGFFRGKNGVACAWLVSFLNVEKGA